MAGYGDSNQSGWCVFKQISQKLDLCAQHRFSFQVTLRGRLGSGRGNVLRSLEAPAHSSSLCRTRLKVSETLRDNMMVLCCRQSIHGEKK